MKSILRIILLLVRLFFLLSHTITFSCLSNFVDLFSVSNLKLVE